MNSMYNQQPMQAGRGMSMSGSPFGGVQNRFNDNMPVYGNPNPNITDNMPVMQNPGAQFADPNMPVYGQQMGQGIGQFMQQPQQGQSGLPPQVQHMQQAIGQQMGQPAAIQQQELQRFISNAPRQPMPAPQMNPGMANQLPLQQRAMPQQQLNPAMPHPGLQQQQPAITAQQHQMMMQQLQRYATNAPQQPQQNFGLMRPMQAHNPFSSQLMQQPRPYGQ